jgi:hypothetical protein
VKLFCEYYFYFTICEYICTVLQYKYTDKDEKW